MATWIKIAAAIIIGALVLGTIGTIMQNYLYLCVYSRHTMGWNDYLMISSYVCSFLGAVTASAFTLFKLSEPHRVKAAGVVCIAGALLALIYLYSSRNPFITDNPYHGALAATLLVYGIPYVWAIALAWQGCKLMWTNVKQSFYFLAVLVNKKNHEKRPTAITN
jgi:hypothetical protein